MNTIADVLDREFGRSWHECVAIVQETASLMQPGLALPGPEDLLLSLDGRLTFGFGSEASENPVTGLAGLLLHLLDSVEAPGGLRDLAVENATARPAHPSVESFSQALAFYERPNRSNDLRAVAGRLSLSRERSSVDQEFARLREKVAKSEATEPEALEPGKDRPRFRLTLRQRQVLAGGVLAGLLGGFASLQLRGGEGLQLSGVLTGVEDGVTGAVTAGLNQIGFSIPAAAAPNEEPLLEKPTGSAGAKPPVQRTKEPPASRHAARSEATTAVARPAAPSRTSPGGPAAPRRPSPPVVPALVGGLAAVEPLTHFESADAVYSPEDDTVAPPELVRPQLPREPRPGEDTGWFDLLVDETGTVEQVKLISPAGRYQERMLVAAAKAWKFRPATRDGQPVKYRVRIPIILPVMP